MSRTNEFLKRIGLEGLSVEHTLDFLGKVQNACVLSIPYENLDILAGIPVSLDGNNIYEKIVTRNRGGYCFELNALLDTMLSEMGFTARSRFARFLRGESSIPFRRHRIVIVALDGEDYLLDIGVGQIAPRFPLKLEENISQVQGDEVYRFERDENLGWVLCDMYKGEWRRYICFTDTAEYEVDFEPASFWCEKHPDSPFNKAPMLAIKTKDGRKTVDVDAFKVFKGDALIEIREKLSEDELRVIYKEHFGITI